MSANFADRFPASDLEPCETPEAAFERLNALYAKAVSEIDNRFEQYSRNGTVPEAGTAPTYPYIGAKIGAEYATQTSKLSMGELVSSSYHGATITRPPLFKDYLLEQLTLLKERFHADIYVGSSRTPIPLTFALERAPTALSADQRGDLQQFFHLPNLAATNDLIVDGASILHQSAPFPLSLFPAERVDYSLHRLRHYTATAPEHFQKFVIFTNYQRYVDEFVAYALEQIEKGEADALVEPGGRIHRKGAPSTIEPLAKMPQMPAYHLTREGGMGITFINIGVGPSNAKTVTDHLAVLRPHVWMMAGHCAGLRRTQRLGDYVLAHAYLRDDHVLDAALPTAIPLPTIAEVQLALTRAVQEVTGLEGAAAKDHLRTGTVVTTDDRNWELRFDALAERFNQSRAIAIDMESATIAANGYRFRVPYGTLLCVSDRPLHGEIKLPGMADAFYEERVGQHLKIAIEAIGFMREAAREGTLHSRKLRSFDEPVFR